MSVAARVLLGWFLLVIINTHTEIAGTSECVRLFLPNVRITFKLHMVTPLSLVVATRWDQVLYTLLWCISPIWDSAFPGLPSILPYIFIGICTNCMCNIPWNQTIFGQELANNWFISTAKVSRVQYSSECTISSRKLQHVPCRIFWKSGAQSAFLRHDRMPIVFAYFNNVVC